MPRILAALESFGVLVLAATAWPARAAASNASLAAPVVQQPGLRGTAWPVGVNVSQEFPLEAEPTQLASSHFFCPACDARCKSVDVCSDRWNDDNYKHNGWCWHLCRKKGWECHGSKQSPVAIPVGIRSSGRRNMLRWARYRRVYGLFARKGHSGLEVQAPRSKPLGRIFLDRQWFWVRQFHFHCGSEHSDSSGGVLHIYACEMHVVHENARKTRKVVIALRYKLDSRRSNNFLLRLGVPNRYSSRAPHLGRVRGSIDLRRELAIMSRGFYTYEGSLTTPPCTENVKWYVAASSLPIGLNQWRNMKLLGLVSNRRDTFTAGGRGVKRFSR